ncbi:MAG TPA: hypothetical protein VF552_12420 [Allosphingosinicella sp.]|jgi:hypothetical protein
MSLLALIAAAAAAAMQTPAPAPVQAPPPPLGFAPFTVEVKVAFGPGPAVRDCAVTLHGTPEGHWTDNACRNMGNAGFLAALGAPADANGRATILLVLEAGGQRVGPAAPPEGRLTFRSEARFAVTAAGAVVRCTPGTGTGRGASLNLCERGLPRGNAFIPAAAEREARLTLSAFTVSGASRDEAP